MEPFPTLDRSKVDPQVIRAFQTLRAAITKLEADNAALRQQLAAMPKSLSLAEINHGLSASGAAPLNLTGLVGAPTLSP